MLLYYVIHYEKLFKKVMQQTEKVALMTIPMLDKFPSITYLIPAKPLHNHDILIIFIAWEFVPN